MQQVNSILLSEMAYGFRLNSLSYGSYLWKGSICSRLTEKKSRLYKWFPLLPNTFNMVFHRVQ